MRLQISATLKFNSSIYTNNNQKNRSSVQIRVNLILITWCSGCEMLNFNENFRTYICIINNGGCLSFDAFRKNFTCLGNCMIILISTVKWMSVEYKRSALARRIHQFWSPFQVHFQILIWVITIDSSARESPGELKAVSERELSLLSFPRLFINPLILSFGDRPY